MIVVIDNKYKKRIQREFGKFREFIFGQFNAENHF